jgi:hypothetical protein
MTTATTTSSKAASDDEEDEEEEKEEEDDANESFDDTSTTGNRSEDVSVHGNQQKKKKDYNKKVSDRTLFEEHFKTFPLIVIVCLEVKTMYFFILLHSLSVSGFEIQCHHGDALLV